MIKTDSWECVPEQKEPLLLFVQRARELLLHTTPFLYKPATASVFLITRELSFLTLQEKKTPHSSTNGQIELLVDEFRLSLKSDEIANDLIGDRWRSLEACLTGESRLDDKIEAAQLLRSRIARSEYLEESNKRIASIVSDGGKEKDRLLNLTECAISAIRDAGYPAQTIYHLLNITFLNKKDGHHVTGLETLARFFSYFDLVKHEYTVFFGITKPPADIDTYFPEERYSVVRKGTPQFETTTAGWPPKTKRFFCGANSVDVIVQRKSVRALDPQSARASAETSLALHADVVRSRLHRYALNVKNEAIVFRPDKNEYVQSNRPKAPIHRNPKDTDVSADDIRHFLARLNMIEQDSITRYVRAVQLHSTALEAKEVESQLLNMWIAFEALFVRGNSDSKLAEVITSIEPYVLIGTLWYDIQELWDHINTNHKALWDSIVDEIDDLKNLKGFQKLLALIAVRKFEPQMTNFLSKLTDDPLLKNRLWQRISGGQKAKKLLYRLDFINSHTKRDLSRIYRFRNQIVHVGSAASEIGEAVQKAHHYLDVVLTTIETVVGRAGGAFTIEQVTLEMRIMKENLYDSLREAAKNDAECSLENFLKLNLGREVLT